MSRLAQQLASPRKQRNEVASEVELLVHTNRLWPILTRCRESESRPPPDSSPKSLPKPSRQLHLAVYAGLASVTDARALLSLAITHLGAETRC